MTDPSGGGRRLWYGVVAVLLAATLLFWSLRGVEWARVWQAIAHAHWEYLAGSMLVACVSFFLRSLRWRILLNTNYRFGVGTVFMANMAGYLGNTFLPARAGEFVRSYLISSRSTLSKMYVLTTALSERVVDAMVLVLASSVALAGVAAKPAWLGQISHASALAAGAGLAAIAIVPHTGNLVERILRRLPLPERWQVRLGDLAAQVLGGLRTFHNVGRLGGFGLATGAIWTLDCLSVMVGARALGIELSFRMALLLIAGMGLGSALPSTPGYVGVYQFVMVETLVPFGVSRDAALAYSLVNQAASSMLVVLLGLPGLLRAGDWRRALREEQEGAPVAGPAAQGRTPGS